MKKSVVVLFLLALGLLATLPESSSASQAFSMNSKGETYAFFHDKTFYTSNTGVTARIYVVAAEGVTLIPVGTKKHGDVYMPTIFTMEVNGKRYSSSASVIDEPLPYILYSIPEDEYREIGGKMLPVKFFVYGREIKTEIRFWPMPEKNIKE